jgi:hypothetical protein
VAAIMISTEPIGSIPSPQGFLEAVPAQGAYFNSLPLAKVTARAFASEGIEGR